MFLQSLSRSDSPLPVLDYLRLEPSLSPRSVQCLEPISSVMGRARLEFIMFASDFLRLGLTTSLQSHACSGLFLFVPYTLRIGFSPPLQSFSYVGFALFALDFLHPELSVSARSPVCLAFSVSSLGCAAMDLSLPVSDFLHLGPFLLLRSCGHTGSSLLVLDFTRCGLLPLLQASAHVGLMLPAFGLTCLGSVFSLFVIDVTTLGSFPFVRSSTHLGLPLFALDLLNLDSSFPLQESCHLESAFLVFGTARPDPTSPVLEYMPLGFPLFVRSMSCCDSVMFVPDLLRLEFMLPLQSFSYPEPFLSVMSVLRAGLSPLPLEHLTLGPSVPLQSSMRFDFGLLVLDLLRPGSLTLSRSIC